MKTIEEKALEFATNAHEGQKRKYTGEPYINHPIAVAAMVRAVGGDENMMAAALLHDTVEGCGIELDEIRDLFGCDIAYMVEDLTDVSTAHDGVRRIRKEKDRDHTRTATPRAKTIKLADLIDNSKSILDRDPKFAEVYIAEKALLLEVLTEGDRELFYEANTIVNDYCSAIMNTKAV